MGTRDTCRLERHPEPFVILGTRGALAGFRGKYHSLDFTVHSGASGRLRRTRRLPGKVLLVGLAAHSGLPGLASGFGTRGQVSCSEGDSEGFRKGFRLASGTRGLLRKIGRASCRERVEIWGR